MLIDGRRIAEKINKITAGKVKKMLKRGCRPTIAVFLVGHRPESEVYVKQKEKLAKKLGFVFKLKRLPANVRQSALVAAITRLQNKKTVSGIIVQLPLPKHVDAYKTLSCLKPETDIDCLSDVSLGRLILANHIVEPPTAGAALEILKDLRVDLGGKKIVVIGSGLLVGKPLVILLMNEQATVIVANKSTKNLSAVCRQADIIISGAGQKNLIKPNMVKKNAIVIDAGFSFQKGKASGDADVAGLDKKGARVTPTPGGVGPITVARLMFNAAVCAEQRSP